MFRPIIVAIFAEVFYAIYSKIILNICIYNCLFYFLQWINRAWSRIIWSGYQVLSQGLKRPELEAHHQPVSSHKVKHDNRYLYPHRYAYLSCKFHWIFAFIFKTPRLHRDAVGWSTALQTGSSWVRFRIGSLEFFIDLILPAALWPWVRISL